MAEIYALSRPEFRAMPVAEKMAPQTKARPSHPPSPASPLSCIPRTTILSLPQELLCRVCLLLERSSAVALALTSRHFTSAAELRIWRELELFVDRYPAPVYPWLEDRYGGDRTAEAAAMRRHKAALNAKIMAIICHGDERKWRMVEDVVVVPTGAASGMLVVLDLVSAHLRTLRFEAPPSDGPKWQYFLESYDRLDGPLFGSSLHFPSLTHLTIEAYSLWHYHLIPHLVNIAPNLLYLSVNFELLYLFPVYPRRQGSMPNYRGKTKIQQLRLVSRDESASAEDLGRYINIILQSPNIRQLSITRLTPGRVDADERLRRGMVLAAVRQCRALEDLAWGCENGRELRDALEAQHTRSHDRPCTNLHRLVLEVYTWSSMFHGIPKLPSLQVIYTNRTEDLDDYDGWAGEDIPHAPQLPLATPLPAQPMLPEFASRILSAAQLRLIVSYIRDLGQEDCGHGTPPFPILDKLERSGRYDIGHIRSFVHGGKELLHARLLLPFIHTSDVPFPIGNTGPTYSVGSEIDHIDYTAHDGSLVTRYYDRLPQPVWQDQTDLDGLVVPVEVIRRMLEVQGIRADEWGGRGMETGEEAWKVVEDWQNPVTSVG